MLLHCLLALNTHGHETLQISSYNSGTLLLYGVSSRWNVLLAGWVCRVKDRSV
jgi:hypothetical protein